MTFARQTCRWWSFDNTCARLVFARGQPKSSLDLSGVDGGGHLNARVDLLLLGLAMTHDLHYDLALVSD